MDPPAPGTRFHSLPRAMVNRKGEALLIHWLDDNICQRLVEMYLAYQPRNSFQGLPPLKDEQCVKWVQHMIRNGMNIVALSFQQGVTGHAALFPADNRVCELFAVVAPEYQNTGIGTELTRVAIRLAYEIGFQRVCLDVEATNSRARHLYRKCGFQYVAARQSREMEMELDLARYREVVEIPVSQIMNTHYTAIHVDQSCRAALELFVCRGVHWLPVIGDRGELLGELSQADLLQPLHVDKQVRDIYTQRVVTADQHATLSQLIRLFENAAGDGIPILGADQKLLGVVSRKDILAYYATRPA
jgi:CBS domain-containing protein/GNAT superfamily N-acetyltransferase